MPKSYQQIGEKNNCSKNNLTYFPFQMIFLIFQNPYEFFIFSYVHEDTVFEKNWGYNRATVTSIIRKILGCHMESYYKNISENVTFVLQKTY